MTDAEKAIQDYLARGGRIAKVPVKGARRKDFEAETLKKRRILADLVERAKAAK